MERRSQCRTAPIMKISEIIDKLKDFYEGKVFHDFYVLLRSCSKQVLANILQSLAGSYDMCSLLIEAFCSRVVVKKFIPKVDRIHKFLVCDFFSKQVDRLYSIFRDTSVESLLPEKVRERTPLKVYFTFTKIIGQS